MDDLLMKRDKLIEQPCHREELIAFIRKTACQGGWGDDEMCLYCEATPIDLVNRGDEVPVLYETKKNGYIINTYCYLCRDTASRHIPNKHIKDPYKQEKLTEHWAFFEWLKS